MKIGCKNTEAAQDAQDAKDAVVAKRSIGQTCSIEAEGSGCADGAQCGYFEFEDDIEGDQVCFAEDACGEDAPGGIAAEIICKATTIAATSLAALGVIGSSLM